MTEFFKVTKKVALVAAFLVYTLLQTSVCAVADAKPVETSAGLLSETKKKVTSLLLLKQREQALDVINKILKDTQDPHLKIKIQEVKYLALTTFMSHEAQEYFELSTLQSLSEPKSSLKEAQKCLAIDIDNIHCLFAELKAYHQTRQPLKSQGVVEKMNLLIDQVPQLQTLKLSLDKKKSAFMSTNFSSKVKDDFFDRHDLLILEFDRSIQAKNYSLAKDILALLEKNYDDYPDIIIMKAILDRITYGKESVPKLLGLVSIYEKKCKAIAKNISRKYFYDLDLCQRNLDWGTN